MGGCIAQELAIRHPGNVRSLVLLATLARRDEWFERIIGVRRAMANDLGLEAQFDLATCLVFSPSSFREHAGLVATVDAAIRSGLPDPTGYARQIDFCLDHDATARLGDVLAPALVIVGEHDLLTTPFLTRELAAALPDARHVEVEHASHGIALEQPQRLAELVREFLAERP